MLELELVLEVSVRVTVGACGGEEDCTTPAPRLHRGDGVRKQGLRELGAALAESGVY